MNKENTEDIKKHLLKYGWKYNFSEPSSFETGWSTKKARFRMLISSNSSFASFTVYIASLHDDSQELELDVLKKLNDFNDKIYFAKVCLTEHKEIILCCDLFNQKKINYNNFKLTLSLLTYYTHYFYSEITKILNKSKKTPYLIQ